MKIWNIQKNKSVLMCGIASLVLAVTGCSSQNSGGGMFLTVAGSGATTPPAPAPAPPATAKSVSLMSDYQVLQVVANDLAAQSSSTQPYLRYFDLAPWGNVITTTSPVLDPVGIDIPISSATPIVPVANLQAALIKMINLLSTAPIIVQPIAIGPGNLIYRIDMRDANWTAAAWTNLKGTDPYLQPAIMPPAFSAAANQTVRADWFVSNIPQSGVNAYFTFLGINSTDAAIDALNGVNRFANMATGAPATYRGGVAVSGESPFNRIISWDQTNTLGSGTVGHLFKTYDFTADSGTSDIFSNPYEPTNQNTNTTIPDPTYAFTFDTSNSIFTLPNGLNAYYQTQGDMGEVTGAFTGPQSCLACHDSNTNLNAFTDNINAAITATPAADFPAALRTLLLGMYNQTEMNSKMAASGGIFSAAYKEMNLPVAEAPGIFTETTNDVFNSYFYVLTVNMAAAELGVTPAQVVTAVGASQSTSQQLNDLTTMSTAGIPNGVVRRDVWEANYALVRANLIAQSIISSVPTTTTPIPTPTPTATPTGDLASQVTTIFTQNCVSCHGASGAGGISNITNLAGLVSSGAIVPGNLGGSEIYTAVSSGTMPLGATLPAADVITIGNWISAGASAN